MDEAIYQWEGPYLKSFIKLRKAMESVVWTARMMEKNGIIDSKEFSRFMKQVERSDKEKQKLENWFQNVSKKGGDYYA